MKWGRWALRVVLLGTGLGLALYLGYMLYGMLP